MTGSSPLIGSTAAGATVGLAALAAEGVAGAQGGLLPAAGLTPAYIAFFSAVLAAILVLVVRAYKTANALN